MNTITPNALRELQDAMCAAYSAARSKPGPDAFRALIETAWSDALNEIRAAADPDGEAAVAIRFRAVFEAFTWIGMDDLTALSGASFSPLEATARRRAVLDKFPALRAWQVECDARAAEIQRRIDTNAATTAERLRREAPQALLTAIRAKGDDLSLDRQGRICASPATLAGVVGGVDAIREHRDALVALLRAEAAERAAAKRAAMLVVIA